MQNRLVDPVHFFDHRGHSVKSYDHLIEENKKLEKRVEELEKKLAAREVRRHFMGDPEDHALILH